MSVKVEPENIQFKIIIIGIIVGTICVAALAIIFIREQILSRKKLHNLTHQDTEASKDYQVTILLLDAKRHEIIFFNYIPGPVPSTNGYERTTAIIGKARRRARKDNVSIEGIGRIAAQSF